MMQYIYSHTLEEKEELQLQCNHPASVIFLAKTLSKY